MLRHRAFTALLLASVVGLGSTACSVDGYPYRGRSDRYDRADAERAFDAGYRAGVEAGRRDAYRGVRYNPGRYGVNGTRDFRNGFRRGYEDGYRRLRRR